MMLAVAAIAREYNSHVIGLYVIPAVLMYPTAETGANTIINGSYKDFVASARKAKVLFERLLYDEGLNGEFRQHDSNACLIVDAVVQHGRHSDLVVLGCESADSNNDNKVDLAATVVRRTGGPVLIVPNSTKKGFPLKNVIIGWDGSREAARASFDAIPLLKMAGNVKLLSVNPRNEMGDSMEVPGIELKKSLSRYGVKVTGSSKNSRRRTGQIILEQSENTDLLVMGAYGHSRLRENILGGVTATILKNMSRPVLMSN